MIDDGKKNEKKICPLFLSKNWCLTPIPLTTHLFMLSEICGNLTELFECGC